jgi:hypothetical protein
VVLNWQTTEETNSDRFEIEHSVNSKQWVNLGSVISHRESNSLQSYTYSHATPAAGENLYRLKMIDRATDRGDGSYAYSKIVSVKWDSDSEVNIYPNPGSGKVNLSSKVPVSAYTLMSVTGKIVEDKQQQNKTLVQIPLTGLSPGLYVIQLSLLNGETVYHKLVVQD